MKLTKAQKARRAERAKAKRDRIKKYGSKGMFTAYSILKASEGGLGAKDAIAMLDDKDIPAEKASGSHYVGHDTIFVYGSQTMRRKAERILFPH